MFDLDTGRRLRTPDGELVERSDASGRRATAVQCAAAWRDRPDQAIPPALEGFLRRPFVVGLAPLVHVGPGETVWDTGPCRWLAELLAEARTAGRPMGVRAAVELWALGAAVVREAAESGAQVGCYAHMGLSPWRMGVLPGGRLVVFGYGVPMADVAAWLDGTGRRADPDHVRYCPPERLLDVGEGEAADQWALAAVVVEMATGQPLLAGTDVDGLAAALRVADVRASVRELAPRALRDALEPMWILDPERRPVGAALRARIDVVRGRDPSGPTLASFVDAAPVVAAEPLPAVLHTEAFSKAALRAEVEGEDALPADASAPPALSPRALRRLGR